MDTVELARIRLEVLQLSISVSISNGEVDVGDLEKIFNKLIALVLNT